METIVPEKDVWVNINALPNKNEAHVQAKKRQEEGDQGVQYQQVADRYLNLAIAWENSCARRSLDMGLLGRTFVVRIVRCVGLPVVVTAICTVARFVELYVRHVSELNVVLVVARW